MAQDKNDNTTVRQQTPQTPQQVVKDQGQEYGEQNTGQRTNREPPFGPATAPGAPPVNPNSLGAIPPLTKDEREEKERSEKDEADEKERLSKADADEKEKAAEQTQNRGIRRP